MAQMHSFYLLGIIKAYILSIVHFWAEKVTFYHFSQWALKIFLMQISSSLVPKWCYKSIVALKAQVKFKIDKNVRKTCQKGAQMHFFGLIKDCLASK